MTLSFNFKKWKTADYYWPGIGLSILFFLVNIFTITWTRLPWLDEIMFADTAVQFSETLEWKTKAWYSSMDREPISTYPPLYQLLLALWYKLFGISLVTARSLNLFLLLMLSLFSCYLANKRIIFHKKFYVLFFLLILWCAESFSIIYRSGRVDFTNVFFVLLFYYSAFLFYHKRTGRLSLILAGILVGLSGIQTIPYIFFGLIVFILIKKDKKKSIIGILKNFVLSQFASILILLLFFYLNNGLIPFVASIVSYSATLKNILATVLPYINNLFGADYNKYLSALQTNNDISFIQRCLSDYLINKEAFFLLLSTILLFLFYAKKIKKESSLVALFIFGSLTPMLMNISGRYLSYYTWMSFIPLLIAFIGFSSVIHNKVSMLVMISITCIIIFFGIKNNLSVSEPNDYKKIRSFISKHQQDLKNVNIATTFISYYDVRTISKNTFCTGIYPLEKIPDSVNFILDSPLDKYTYQSNAILMDQYKKAGKKIILVDSLTTPRLYYYKVTR